MRTIPLEASATVTFDAFGNGLVTISPPVVERWTIQTVTITAAVTTQTPTFRLYLGQGPNVNEQVDGTYNGSQNVSDALAGREVPNGYKLIGQWQSGDAGALATMIVRGTKLVQ